MKKILLSLLLLINVYSAFSQIDIIYAALRLKKEKNEKTKYEKYKAQQDTVEALKKIGKGDDYYLAKQYLLAFQQYARAERACPGARVIYLEKRLGDMLCSPDYDVYWQDDDMINIVPVGHNINEYFDGMPGLAVLHYKQVLLIDSTDSYCYYKIGNCYSILAKSKEEEILKAKQNYQLHNEQTVADKINALISEKAKNKALAEQYLKKAIRLGYADAKPAYESLNGI